MEIVIMNVADLIPYDENPRDNREAIEKVANSISEFGFKVPIVIDKNNVIVAGHTRLLAAQRLGLEEVPCIIADDLSDEQIRAFRLADNKTSEFSKWDEDLLTSELLKIDNIDMDLFGFMDIEEIESEDLKEAIEQPEVEFTEVLGEEHNYIVLYFDNEVDWLQAESLFDIKSVKGLNLSENPKSESKKDRMGVGRVLNGAWALEKIRKGIKDV